MFRFHVIFVIAVTAENIILTKSIEFDDGINR